MGLKEKTVHTDGRRSKCQRFDHRAIPAGRSTEPSGLLDRMGRIEDDRNPQTPHLRQSSHVVDQSTIPEKSTSLAQKDPTLAGTSSLINHEFHIARCHKLPLLDIQWLASRCTSDQKIGLTRQKRWDL